MSDSRRCPLCAKLREVQSQREAVWASPELIDRLSELNPDWEASQGACPACLQEALLEVMLREGDAKAHESLRTTLPLDAASSAGALPTPLRMHADPQYTARGVTLAMVDAGFYPHPDLCLPHNRIRAWVNAAVDPVVDVR